MSKFRKLTDLFYVLLIFTACTSEEKAIVQTEAYSWYADRIEQGVFTAKAFSATEIVSDYKSPARVYQSPVVNFKFAINGEDNEMESGTDHRFIITSTEVETPLIEFGNQVKENEIDTNGLFLPSGSRWTIRLDMRKMIRAFETKGVYITPKGDKINKEDFKGVYVAGDVKPLTWDFEELKNRPDLELKDLSGNGIYEITLNLNTASIEEKTKNRWIVNNNLKQYPQYTTSSVLETALYNMALDEMVNAIEPDSTLRTGKEWSGVWTRDVSYSIILSMAHMLPRVSMNSLIHKVNPKGRIIQDTGTGGAWPCSSDRMIWAVAAWEIYKVTGSHEWLQIIYPIIKNSLEDDFLTVYNPETGLVMGESSFIDWRKQSYPLWMEPADIYQSQCLGTNVVHVEALRVLSRIATILDKEEEASRYQTKSIALTEAINKHLWMEEKGYYGAFLYGRNYPILTPQSETLGESLAILYEVACKEQQNKITRNMPVVDFGPPIFYPQIPGIPPYHNNGIWPFVTSYWMHACAKTGNEPGVLHSIGSIYRAAALFTTNKENFVAENGDYSDTQINSDNMLWSLAGNISIIHKLLFGIQFHPDGLEFIPFVPKALNDTRELTNFTYRGAKLTIQVKGYGNKIKSFTLDGKEQPPFIPANITGKHTIRIVLNNQPTELQSINRVANIFSPPTPVTKPDNNKLSWQPIENISHYIITKDGHRWLETEDSFLSLDETSNGEIQVIAVNNTNIPSFASEPFSWNQWSEQYTVKQRTPQPGHSLTIPVTIQEPGTYAIDWLYANGHGPIETNNKCAIRTLFINDQQTGVSVFPQRGTDEWENKGYSNPIKIPLETGIHIISLKYMPFNDNMNLKTNDAWIESCRIKKIN